MDECIGMSNAHICEISCGTIVFIKHLPEVHQQMSPAGSFHIVLDGLQREQNADQALLKGEKRRTGPDRNLLPPKTQGKLALAQCRV